MEKITYLGNQVWPKQKRKRGKFARRWMSRSTKFSLSIIAIAVLVFYGFAPNYDKWLSKEIVATATPQIAAAAVIPDTKLDQLKEKLLDKMVACENPSHVLLKQDDNKAGTLPLKDKVSIGDLQYKISTVQRFYKTLHGTSLTDKEAADIAMDTKQARELAIQSWIEIPGSILEWSCVTPEMKQMVYDIRFLEGK